MSEVLDRDEKETLEAQRDFLLRSLDDLEVERADGNIDARSYARLHDDYTARAAAVIRALRDGVDARPPPPSTSWRRRTLVAAAVAAFAVVAAVALAAALGARLPGDLGSGNELRREAPPDDVTDELEQAVAERPDDVRARLALALARASAGELPAALRQWDEVIRRDPANAEALAQSGRALYLTAERVKGTPEAGRLVADARARLDRALAADPDYADARFFRAVLLAQELLDQDQAITDAQRYLVLAPEGPFAGQARELLTDLDADVPPGTAPTTTRA